MQELNYYDRRIDKGHPKQFWGKYLVSAMHHGLATPFKL